MFTQTPTPIYYYRACFTTGAHTQKNQCHERISGLLYIAQIIFFFQNKHILVSSSPARLVFIVDQQRNWALGQLFFLLTQGLFRHRISTEIQEIWNLTQSAYNENTPCALSHVRKLIVSETLDLWVTLMQHDESCHGFLVNLELLPLTRVPIVLSITYITKVR